MGLLNGTSQQQYYSGNDYGNYQFTSLEHIINQFIVAYVGEDKIIPKVKRTDVQFHAMRALQELSFDTFKSCKSHEVEIPSSLTMILPQDYVNYTKISWVDSSGIKHRLYPTTCKTSNPFSPQIDDDGEYLFHDENLIPAGNLLTNGNFLGSSDGWRLNETQWSHGGVGTHNASLVTSGANIGNPDVGWFYGHDGNTLRAYDVVQYQGIVQHNVPIIAGEEYTVTYTLSGYTSGEWLLFIVDENGDATTMTRATADGTYSETLTAGEDAGSRTQGVYLRNEGTASGNVILDNISIVRVGDEDSSTTWGSYSSATPSDNQDDYQDDTYWPRDGERYGLDPQHAQTLSLIHI